VALLAREPVSEELEFFMESSAGRYASLLTYVETRAALAARRRASARSRVRLGRTRTELEARWEEVDVVDFDALVARVAGLAAEQHRLRGADAIHLASAAVLGSGVTMLSLDESLRRASLAVGLDVAP
jgi:predicted nucleic acid-binding protein